LLGDLSDIVNLVDLRIPEGLPLAGTGAYIDSDPTQSTLAVTGLGPLVTDIVADLVQEEISNADGSVIVDLSNGEIRVNLEQLIIDATGAVDLNSLGANTEVLQSAVITAITQGII